MTDKPTSSLTVERRHREAARDYWRGPKTGLSADEELARFLARFEADHLTSTDRLRDALEPFASMATEMERVAAQHGIHPSKVGRSHSYEHCVAAREALTSTPAPSGEREALAEAEIWLRAISTWLLETDNDMKLPNGILDTDPEDIADRLAALQGHAS